MRFSYESEWAFYTVDEFGYNQLFATQTCKKPCRTKHWKTLEKMSREDKDIKTIGVMELSAFVPRPKPENFVPPVVAPKVVVSAYVEFKVLTRSENTNSFGLHGVIIMDREGNAFQIGVNALNLPERGKVLNCKIGSIGNLISIEGLSYEIPERKPKAPIEAAKDLWEDSGWVTK